MKRVDQHGFWSLFTPALFSLLLLWYFSSLLRFVCADVNKVIWVIGSQTALEFVWNWNETEEFRAVHLWWKLNRPNRQVYALCYRLVQNTFLDKFTFVPNAHVVCSDAVEFTWSLLEVFPVWKETKPQEKDTSLQTHQLIWTKVNKL